MLSARAKRSLAAPAAVDADTAAAACASASRRARSVSRSAKSSSCLRDTLSAKAFSKSDSSRFSCVSPPPVGVTIPSNSFSAASVSAATARAHSRAAETSRKRATDVFVVVTESKSNAAVSLESESESLFSSFLSWQSSLLSSPLFTATHTTANAFGAGTSKSLWIVPGSSATSEMGAGRTVNLQNEFGFKTPRLGVTKTSSRRSAATLNRTEIVALGLCTHNVDGENTQPNCLSATAQLSKVSGNTHTAGIFIAFPSCLFPDGDLSSRVSSRCSPLQSSVPIRYTSRGVPSRPLGAFSASRPLPTARISEVPPFARKGDARGDAPPPPPPRTAGDSVSFHPGLCRRLYA